MSFFNKLKESASRATDKAKDSVEVVRLNSQISSKRKEIESQYITIGEAVFQAKLNNELETIESLISNPCNDIMRLNNEIEQLEHKIKIIKDEKDCVCGNTLSLSAKFCSNCGHKFEDDKAEEVIVVKEENITYLLQDSNESAVEKQCPACQAAVGQEDQFCESCGSRINDK